MYKPIEQSLIPVSEKELKLSLSTVDQRIKAPYVISSQRKRAFTGCRFEDAISLMESFGSATDIAEFKDCEFQCDIDIRCIGILSFKNCVFSTKIFLGGIKQKTLIEDCLLEGTIDTNFVDHTDDFILKETLANNIR